MFDYLEILKTILVILFYKVRILVFFLNSFDYLGTFLTDIFIYVIFLIFLKCVFISELISSIRSKTHK